MMSLLSNRSLLLYLAVTILITSCETGQKRDKNDIVFLVCKIFIKPIVYPQFLNKHQTFLSQEDYDNADFLFLESPSMDSLWYSKILSNNKFTYMLSDTMGEPKEKDINIKMMAMVNGIDLNQKKSSIDKIDFSIIDKNNNIKRIANKKDNPHGSIFIGKFKISRIYFDNKNMNAYTEITGINKKDTVTLPILLKKENGKWKIKNL